MGIRTLPLKDIGKGEYRVTYQIPEGLLWTCHRDIGAISIHLVLLLLTHVPTINEGTAKEGQQKALC